MTEGTTRTKLERAVAAFLTETTRSGAPLEQGIREAASILHVIGARIAVDATRVEMQALLDSTRREMSALIPAPLLSNDADDLPPAQAQGSRTLSERLTAERNETLHPSVAASMPPVQARPLLSPGECMRGGRLYCARDGQRTENLELYVDVTFDLGWEEYLSLAGLPPDFPKTERLVPRLAWTPPVDHLPQKLSPAPRRMQMLRESGTGPKIVMPVEESITPDKIYCLFDRVGRSMITRHVRAKWGMTWDEYIEYCGLPADYPRVAPNYSEGKSQTMVNILNRKPPSKAERDERRRKALEVKRAKLLVDPSTGLRHSRPGAMQPPGGQQPPVADSMESTK